jgi:nicotinate-nucleotide pyrophosphorylase (carboxylating)
LGRAQLRNSLERTLRYRKKERQKNQKIEIECDNYQQVVEATELAPDIIMLDNMDVAAIKKCSALIRKKSPKTKIEISGGVNLDNISRFSKLDIDFISVGALTHSVAAVDIGLDVV